MPVAVLLFRWRREGRTDAFVLGVYLMLAGAIRFVIEFVRINDHVVGPLTLAHIASLLVVAVGGTLMRRRPDR